jgi:hypothetical protein
MPQARRRAEPSGRQAPRAFLSLPVPAPTPTLCDRPTASVRVPGPARSAPRPRPSQRRLLPELATCQRARPRTFRPWRRRPGRGKAARATEARTQAARGCHWPRPLAGRQGLAPAHVRRGLHLGVLCHELGAQCFKLPVGTGRPHWQRSGRRHGGLSGHGGCEPGTSAQQQAGWLTHRRSHARWLLF